MVHRVEALLRARLGIQDVAGIAHASGNQNGMSRLLPFRALQHWMSRRECAGGALAMDPRLAAKARDLLLLRQVVADLVDQLRLLSKRLLERLSDRLPDKQAVRNCEVGVRGYRA